MSEPEDGRLGPRASEATDADAGEMRAAIEQLVDEVARRPYNDDLIRRLEWVIDVLVLRGHLTAGHRRLVDRMKGGEGGAVRLTAFPDKRALVGPAIDCASLLPLCKGRCCAMDVALSAEDLAEGTLRWDLHQPYLLRKDRTTGYCGCLGRDGGCTVYADRPAVCRVYDCRKDPRVWIDFEQRIPAPLAPWLVPPGSPADPDPEP